METLIVVDNVYAIYNKYCVILNECIRNKSTPGKCILMCSFAVLITGIPSSGKTTLAGRLAGFLRGRGFRVEVLDGYFVRNMVLGYTDTDFTPNTMKRILGCLGWMARLLVRNGVVVVVSGVFPGRASRMRLRSIIGSYPLIHVYLDCDVEACSRRDNKGLYKRFLTGKIETLPGVNPPYEDPGDADLVIDTRRYGPDEALRILVGYLEDRGLV